MTDFEIKENYSQICNLLASRELKPAFDKFEKLISGLAWWICDEYNNLEQNYRFMLNYTVEGITDPEGRKYTNICWFLLLNLLTRRMTI